MGWQVALAGEGEGQEGVEIKLPVPSRHVLPRQSRGRKRMHLDVEAEERPTLL